MRRAEEQRLPLRREVRRMRRMSGRKPMSSMRSASSSTRYFEPVELRVRRAGSDRAAGPACATMTSTPLRNACSCGPMPTPPNTAAPVIGVCTASSLRSSRICAASSRVGVSTSARVVPRGLSDQPRAGSGSRKAAVLPLPVAAQRQDVAALEGRWNGLGLDGRRRAKPSSFRPRRRLGCSLSAVKGTRISGHAHVASIARQEATLYGPAAR